MLSLGTGEKVFNGFDAASASRLDFMLKPDEFMMNIDTYTAHNWLKMNMPSEDYLRL